MGAASAAIPVLMFDFELEKLDGGRVHQFQLRRDGEPLRYADVFDLWQNAESFRSLFISLLADTPFTAFRWETPPVTTATADREFEFVILDSPALALPPDPTPFESYLSRRLGFWNRRLRQPRRGRNAGCPESARSGICLRSHSGIHTRSTRRTDPRAVENRWQRHAAAFERPASLVEHRRRRRRVAAREVGLVSQVLRVWACTERSSSRIWPHRHLRRPLEATAPPSRASD